ncbi:hypothetical protein OSSY52_09110 [Tepiditoga spiralis]|uniref:Uncharacterized protein n=1 Tax=Tepiditoga spiralis TaxID=2108365 RepID=A0A7G1G2X8_9BACT|nr:hypothetical protein [Tepiditoga spiralis]BBE30770.1 hypothetical protein OSSY52_09110 [Tepiditoga spiralis]
MKKYFFISFLLVLLLIFSSCNTKTVILKASPKVQAPVGATSVSLSGFITDLENQIKQSLPIKIVNRNPLTFRYATDLINVSVSDFFSSDQINLDSFSKVLNQNFDVPLIPAPENLGDFSIPSVTIGSVPDIGINIVLPGITEAEGIEVNQHQTSSQTISTGLSGTEFVTATLKGNIEVNLTQNAFTNLDTEIYILKVTQGTNVLKTFNLLKGSNILDLSGITIEPKDLGISFEATLIGSNANVKIDENNPEILASITPHIALASISGAKITLKQDVNLTIPAILSSATFKSGSKLSLHSNEIQFKSVNGNFNIGSQTIPLSVTSGDLTADLSDATLTPSDNLNINASITADIPDASMSPMSASASLENIGFSNVVINNSDLDFHGNQTIPIPSVAKGIVDNIVIDSGKVTIEWKNTTPFVIKSKILSNVLGINESVNLDITNSGSHTINLSGKTLDFKTLDNIDFSYSASPTGYNGSTLSLSNVNPGDSYTFEATILFDGNAFNIGSITINATTIKGSLGDPMDLSFSDNDMADMLNKIQINKVPLTFVSTLNNVDMNGSVTIAASYTDTTGSSKTTNYNPITLGTSSTIDASDIINSHPKDLELGYSINIDSAVLNGTNQSIEAGVLLDLPFKFSVSQDTTITNDIKLSEGDILGRNEENAQDMKELLDGVMNENLVIHLGIMNTTGAKVKVQFIHDGAPVNFKINDQIVNGLLINNSEFKQNLAIDITNIFEQIKNTNPYPLSLRIILPEGVYNINADGKLDADLWVSIGADFKIPLHLNQ